MKKWIIIGSIATLVLITIFFAFVYDIIPKPDGRYRYTENLYIKNELIGLTIDDCKEKLGNEMYYLWEDELYGERYIVYYAGRTVSSFIGMKDIKDYIIEIYFNKNDIAVRNIKKWWP